MKNQEKGIHAFFTKFSTDEKCRAYLEHQRWGNIVHCPFCFKPDKIYKFRNNKTYKCGLCKLNFSVVKGTIFERSHIPLTKWFIAIYLFASHKKGISSHQIAKDIDITQANAWFMLQRIRYAMNHCEDFRKVMSGVIEVDETYIGGKNKNRHWDKKVPNSQGRSLADKSVVFGILTRGGGILTYNPKQLPKVGLQALIRSRVAPGSIVNTDEFLVYKGLHNYFEHGVVQHGKSQYCIGDYHTNSIEGFWSWVKRSIFGIYHNVSKKHLMRYCREISFRYNQRSKGNEEIFDDNLLLCFDCRLMYKELIASPKRLQ